MAKTTKGSSGSSDSKSKFGTRTLRCDCTHPFQDKAYGAQQRVHNVSGDKAYCTVCGVKKDLR